VRQLRHPLDPVDLIRPRRNHGEAPAFVDSEQFFLYLPSVQPRFSSSWLQSKNGQWSPNVLRFSLKTCWTTLRPPVRVTLDLDWFVPVPLDLLAGPPTTHLRVFRRGLGPWRLVRVVSVRRRPCAWWQSETRFPTTSWAMTTSFSHTESGRDAARYSVSSPITHSRARGSSRLKAAHLMWVAIDFC